MTSRSPTSVIGIVPVTVIWSPPSVRRPAGRHIRFPRPETRCSAPCPGSFPHRVLPCISPAIHLSDLHRCSTPQRDTARVKASASTRAVSSASVVTSSSSMPSEQISAATQPVDRAHLPLERRLSACKKKDHSGLRAHGQQQPPDQTPDQHKKQHCDRCTQNHIQQHSLAPLLHPMTGPGMWIEVSYYIFAPFSTQM